MWLTTYIDYTKEIFTKNENQEIYLYLLLVIWSFSYAYLPFFKRIYIFFLTFFQDDLFLTSTDSFIEKEKKKVNKGLLSIHMHILLLIVYLAVNAFVFLGTLDKGQFSLLTEALLTFVIIDTIISKRKELKNDYVLI